MPGWEYVGIEELDEIKKFFSRHRYCAGKGSIL